MPNKKTRNPIYFYALDHKEKTGDPGTVKDIIEKVYTQ
jgi:hypothetical protein